MVFSTFLFASLASACSNFEWGQCGGLEWAGETCCPDGIDCQASSEWYSQCRTDCPNGWLCEDTPTPPPTDPPVDVPSPDDDCGLEWEQCGGLEWDGLNCCTGDLDCYEKSEWYSQCLTACPGGVWNCASTPVETPTSPPTDPPTDPPTNPPVETPTNPPTDPPTDPPTNPPVETPTNPPTDPPTDPPTESSYEIEGASCVEVSYTWEQAGQWSTSYQGVMTFSAPEPGNWFLILETIDTQVVLNGVSWYDGAAAYPLSDQAYVLDPNDAWWNDQLEVEFGMIVDGADPASQLKGHYCLLPVEMELYLDSSTPHELAVSVTGIVGLVAQSMWESGGDAPWSACDENNYTHSPTASCTQRDDGVEYHTLTSPVGCTVDPDMQMTAMTAAEWATLGPMECTPGTDTEECCWWGRGAIQTTGPHNYGVLQRDVVSEMGLGEDLCTNPEAICQHEELKAVGAAYYWTTVVQKDACYFPSLDEYAASGFNPDASAPDCFKFSSGIGGSVNNGAWNSDAHENAKRVANFDALMAPVVAALASYTIGSADASVPECTGNADVDYILHEANVEGVSLITDATSVYTWNGFCIALRQMGVTTSQD